MLKGVATTMVRGGVPRYTPPERAGGPIRRPPRREPYTHLTRSRWPALLVSILLWAWVLTIAWNLP